MLRICAGLVALAVLLFGTRGTGQDKKGPEEKPLKKVILEDLETVTQLKVGAKWHYRVGDAKDGAKVMVHCDRMERMPYKNAKGEELVKEVDVFVLRSTSGDNELTEAIGIVKDVVYRFKAAGKEILPPLPILAATRDGWAVEATSEKTPIKGTFTLTTEKVSLSVEKGGKTFPITHAYKVSGKDLLIGPQRLAVEYWFAPEFGLVKQRTKLETGKEIVLELEKFEPGK